MDILHTVYTVYVQVRTLVLVWIKKSAPQHIILLLAYQVPVLVPAPWHAREKDWYYGYVVQGTVKM